MGGEITGVDVPEPQPVAGLCQSLEAGAEAVGHVSNEGGRVRGYDYGSGADHCPLDCTFVGARMRRQESGRRFHVIVEQHHDGAHGGADAGVARRRPSTVGAFKCRKGVGCGEVAHGFGGPVGGTIHCGDHLVVVRWECLGAQRRERAQQRVPPLVGGNDDADQGPDRHGWVRDPRRKRCATPSNACPRWSRIAAPVLSRQMKSS